MCPPRFGTPRSPDRPSLGPAVGKVARLLGKPFMPWQQHVADVVLEIDPVSGLLVYNEFGLTVPRQSGKSTWLLSKAVHRASATAFFGPRQNLVYTAQTRKDARRKWEEDFIEDLKASKTFGSRVVTHLGNGNEHARFPNRSRFGIESTTEKSGHGSTLDEGYIDEAFAQVDGRVEQAFGPAMITRKNTQLGWISTAGWLKGSPYLEPKVKAGRAQVEAGVHEGLAYFEWSAPEDAQPDDPAVWRDCMPALGHTITEAAIQAELDKALREGKLNDFRRAYLNQWVPKTAPKVSGVVTDEVWLTLADPKPRPSGQPDLYLDVAADQATSTLASGWTRADGVAQVQLAAHEAGTAWVVAAAQRIGGTVRLLKGGTAAFLTPDLERAGVRVETYDRAFYADACGTLAQATSAGTVRHGNQPALNDAVSASRWTSQTPRTLNRKDPAVSPLIAWTCALHGLGQTDSVSDFFSL